MFPCGTLHYLEFRQCFINVCWIIDKSEYNLLFGEVALYYCILEEQILPFFLVWHYFYTNRLARKLTSGDFNNIETASITFLCAGLPEITGYHGDLYFYGG